MKRKSILAALLLLLAGLQTTWAQGFRVYKSDGTIMQFSMRTDSIVFYDGIGTDVDFGPFTPVNQCIIGTWYGTNSITFNEDGTTDYMTGATYEFLPYQGTLLIYNAKGKLTELLRVPKVTKDYIVLSKWSSDTFSVLSATQLVTRISITPSPLILLPGNTTTITATVFPDYAVNKELEWTSSDEAVAVVSDYFGTIKVMAKDYGECVITATAKDGSGVKAECKVYVGVASLSGEWRGDFGMFYRYQDRYGNLYTFNSYDTYLCFIPSFKHAPYGTGTQVEYYEYGPYEYQYYKFNWSISDGIVYLNYPYDPGLSTSIRDYQMTDDYFTGYCDGASTPFRLYKVVDYYDWSRYNGNYGYNRRDNWENNYPQRAPATRSASDVPTDSVFVRRELKRVIKEVPDLSD